MDIRNHTPFAHSLALGMGPDRQTHIGVVVKATYRIPDRVGGEPDVAAEQLPVETGDDYFRGDVTGSVRTEAETYVFKPRADIVLVGHAYAPGGTPTTAMDVGLRVGRLQQTIRVTGDRRWIFPTRLQVVPVMTEPEPFTAMPLVYERAFGGWDHKGGTWEPQNPIGRGHIGTKTRESVDGQRLPNLEDPGRLIRSWDDQPDPVGWGVFGKPWQPRAALTGRDIDNLHPDFGLPADFDHAFNNGAHPALQVPYLTGDEEVELRNVTPDGVRRFRLPGVRPAVTLRVYTAPPGADERPTRDQPFAPVLDTLVLFPDDGVFTLVWRASRPISTDLETALLQIAAIDIAETSREDRVQARPGRGVTGGTGVSGV